MSLKKLFNVMKDEGIIIPRLNKHLLKLGDDGGRNHGLNSPSGVSSCPRSIYYTRKQTSKDGAIDPRTRRIFDNGHHVHDRLQTYLAEEGTLILAETPVWSRRLKILGHCDGMIKVSRFEIGILEIKSINSNQFSALNKAKPEHQMQAQVYMLCLEELREYLNEAENDEQYEEIKTNLLLEFHGLLSTFVEKIDFQLQTMANVMDILWNCQKPINTMSVIYENKDNQELKEFVIKWDDALVKEIEDKYTYINAHVAEDKLPPRPEEVTGKSCSTCRYCNFTSTCWR